MKVHFIGALEGEKNDYARVIEILEKNGCEILTKHSVERKIEDVEHEDPSSAQMYAKRMRLWIMRADAIVVEATTQVLGTGYEIALALQLEKPVIVLYRQLQKNTPHVLKGVESEKLQVYSYTDQTLEKTLSMALDYARDTIDVRFNFFISPKINRYLDWISRQKKTPRSVYLRSIIEQDMKKNPGFLKAETKE
jgi:nucleoside 2-deoxyribosyltransferase